MTRPGAAASEQRTLADLDSELAAFSDEIFSGIRRADQRRWAQAYLSGLLITPGKKSVRRLAHCVSTSPTAAQSLRQFVSTSPWNWDAVMRNLTRWVEACRPASAWTVQRVVIPKSGAQSVGVHRYFDPNSGRTLNCQVGIGAFLSIGSVQVPVEWRLHLPAVWTKDEHLRRRARVPEAVEYRPLEAQMLNLIDTLADRASCPSVPLVADMSGAPDADSFVRGLSRRGRGFIVTLPPHTRAHPTGESAPRSRGLLSAAECLAAASTAHDVVFTSEGEQQRRTQVRSALVRLPGGRTAGADVPFRLLAEVTQDRRSGPVWITNLTDRPLDEVMSLSTLRTSVTTSIGTMKRDFGLGDFEGRSFPGWHRHMALVSSAYAFRHLDASFSSAPNSPRDPCAGVPLPWVLP
ncbi:IS701 family transposase [Streptomyces sp. NPDC058961]|uniref:IS701 family transposase n=1 Tax=unclassified Streptomyces TaxID=2593676 RepID=UPI001F3F9551|nr:transposase [Streptomyces sp. CB01201]